MIAKLSSLLNRRDKQYLVLLLFFSIFISAIETIGVGIVMPFIQLASDFSLVHSNEYLKKIYEILGFDREMDLVVLVGVLLIFFYLFRSGVNLLYQHLLVRFAQGRYHLLAFRLFQNYMGMPYKEFIKKNSGYLTKSIVTEAVGLTGLIQNALFLVSEFFVVLFIYIMLLFVNVKVTTLLTLILAVKVVLLKVTVSKKIKIEGNKRAAFQKDFFETVGSSFANFKFIKLTTNEEKVLKTFGKSSMGYTKANITNYTLQQVPRLFLEAVGFGLMVFVIVYLILKYQSDIKNVIPLLSVYVLALYRLLPSVNRIIASYNQIMFSHKSLDIVHTELNYDIEEFGNQTLKFNESIHLKSIEFSYETDKPLFDDLSLVVRKGDKIAFVGESGSGKSTLVDIIIGLYKPKAGKILIDGIELNENNVRSWRQKIGYIPQSIYLFDGNVGDNVIFGREYDEAKLIEVLKKANIWDFLQSKEGLQTRVGEGGVVLSGGQKQRIAIARALYGDPEILVLDEATSALDNETETKIMEEIYSVSQDKTLIIIAHRLSTIERCSKIYKITDGRVSTQASAL